MHKSQRPSLRCQLLSTLISACVLRVVPYLSQYLSPRDLSGCSVFSKFPIFAVSGICFPHQSYREVVDSCILFAVIENWDILFSLVKSLFVTDVSIYLETARQVFRYFILAGILSFRVLGLSLAWFHSLILFGLFQFLR